MSRRLLEVAVKVIGWLGALWALTANPALGTVCAYLGATIAAFAHEYRFQRRRSLVRPIDAKLAEAFSRELPYQPTIAFLANTPMLGGFAPNDIEPLVDFTSGWVDESHKFLDAGLEKGKGDLRSAIHEFLALLPKNTWDKGDRFSVFPNEPERSGDPPTSGQKRADLLDAAADRIVAAHQAMVRRVREAGGRPSIGETALIIFTIAAIIIPMAVLLFNRDRAATVVTGRMATLRDSVSDVLASNEKTARLLADSLGSRHEALQKTGHHRTVAALARLADAADSLLYRCAYGSVPSEAEAEKWSTKVEAAMKRGGLPIWYLSEFRSAVDPLRSAQIKILGNPCPILQERRDALRALIRRL